MYIGRRTYSGAEPVVIEESDGNITVAQAVFFGWTRGHPISSVARRDGQTIQQMEFLLPGELELTLFSGNTHSFNADSIDPDDGSELLMESAFRGDINRARQKFPNS